MLAASHTPHRGNRKDSEILARESLALYAAGVDLCTELQQFGVRRKGCCVRSKPFGLGQVVDGGDEPLVRFLDGRECCVPADTLRFVPEEEFDAEITNRSAIEVWLILRVHGRGALGPGSRLWVKDADGLWATTNKLPGEPTCPPGVIEFFFPDDVGDDARVVGRPDLPDDRDVIDCTVTHMSGRPYLQYGTPHAWQ